MILCKNWAKHKVKLYIFCVNQFLREKRYEKWSQLCKQKQSLLFNFCNIFDFLTSRTQKIAWWPSVFKPDFYIFSYNEQLIMNNSENLKKFNRQVFIVSYLLKWYICKIVLKQNKIFHDQYLKLLRKFYRKGLFLEDIITWKILCRKFSLVQFPNHKNNCFTNSSFIYYILIKSGRLFNYPVIQVFFSLGFIRERVRGESSFFKFQIEQFAGVLQSSTKAVQGGTEAHSEPCEISEPVKSIRRAMSAKSSYHSLHKKWSFPLRISSVNVTKSAVSCGFGHIHWRNP